MHLTHTQYMLTNTTYFNLLYYLQKLSQLFKIPTNKYIQPINILQQQMRNYLDIIGQMRQQASDILQPNKIPQLQKPVFRMKEWMTGIGEEDSNHLKIHIFNFFVSQGHYDLAKTFAEEANINPPKFDQQQIKMRLHVKNLIKTNLFDQAITIILDHSKMEKQTTQQKQLVFSLKSLKVIHMIKLEQVELAINTAATELVPYIKENIKYLEKVQKVMSLIAFINIKECSNSKLADNQHKNKIADDVNKYLVGDSENYHSLKILLSVGRWVQNRLQNYVNFPKINLWGNQIYQN